MLIDNIEIDMPHDFGCYNVSLLMEPILAENYEFSYVMKLIVITALQQMGVALLSVRSCPHSNHIIQSPPHWLAALTLMLITTFPPKTTLSSLT